MGLVLIGAAVAMCAAAMVGLAMDSPEGARDMGISAAAVAVLAGIALALGRRAHLEAISRRNALLVVALCWGSLCLVGGLPFLIGADFRVSDAIFESTSGFTTTGATSLPEIEDRLNPALHFWRLLMHWLGGMGIVVLFVAILPALGVGGKHLYRSEVPGPRKRGLSPRIRESASFLWKVYVVLTCVEIVALWLAGLPLFEATTHAFSTVATGGFSTQNASAGGFDLAGVEWIITLFMIIAGMNFGLFHDALRRGPAVFWRDAQTRAYLGILGCVAAVIAVVLVIDGNAAPEAARDSAFQTASIMTGTGLGTADFEEWPSVTRMLLLGFYFTGACSGSTSGGMKLSRVMVLVKAAVAELRRSFRPHRVEPVRVGRAAVDPATLGRILAFMGVYVLAVGLGAIWVALVEGVDGTTSLMASLACVSNVGPGYGLVGPTDHFGFFSGPTKLVLSSLMLLGRLEFLTILALFTPGFWRR